MRIRKIGRKCILIVICTVLLMSITSCGDSAGLNPLVMGCNHQWKGASCTEAAVCTKCGETRGNALGHQWESASCETPATCSICGMTNGSASAHVWREANYAAPKTCEKCGQTKGYIQTYTSGNYGSKARQVVSFRKWDVYPFVMSVSTKNCVSFTFTLSLWDVEWGNPYGSWEVYCKKPNGEWVLIQNFDVQNNMTTVEVHFDQPMEFTEVAVNRLSTEGCKHQYKLTVTEYSLYIE